MKENMEVSGLDILLSFVPVLLLAVLPLLTNIRFAAVIAFLATTVLFFVWRATAPFYFATLVASLVATINILMIVFGAVFLYEMMQASGYISQISESVRNIHPAKEVRFFLIAIGLTGFFEGVAGFGTPGAIVPLLLISMGFQPLLSVAAVLLFNGFFAAFGAVGTPLLAGLKLPLLLDEITTAHTAVYTAWILLAAGVLLIIAITRMYQQQEGTIKAKGLVLLLVLSAFTPYVLFAYLLPEFATILSSVSMLVISIAVVAKNKKDLQLKPWLPYLSLVVLLLLPKLFAPLNQLLDAPLAWTDLFGTSIDAGFKPLKSPLLPFVVVAMVFGSKKAPVYPGVVRAGTKLVSVALLLFPIIAVAQLMLQSGVSKPSMISHIAIAFEQTGPVFLALAPFIGITGAFITGSTTLSNIVFGASQLHTAQLLSLDPALTLATQLAGASMGNAICLFNIIAACSVANIPDINKVLWKNLVPVVFIGLLMGGIAIVISRLGT